jgi:16S rRNA (uracil1498-N3)-methyltransferase
MAAEHSLPAITVLIGPEGDFSPAEVEAAIAAGYRPLTLGDSRLRTETAAVAAVAGVYFMI